SAALFDNPVGVAFDFAGTLMISDRAGPTLRHMDVPGLRVGILAGTAGESGFADGLGTDVRFTGPSGLAFDDRTLWIADLNNCAIRVMNLSAFTVTTLAGLAPSRGGSDGVGGAVQLSEPSWIALADGDTAYFGDDNGIRRLTIGSGQVNTVVPSA